MQSWGHKEFYSLLSRPNLCGNVIPHLQTIFFLALPGKNWKECKPNLRIAVHQLHAELPRTSGSRVSKQRARQAAAVTSLAVMTVAGCIYSPSLFQIKTTAPAERTWASGLATIYSARIRHWPLACREAHKRVRMDMASCRCSSYITPAGEKKCSCIA